MFTYAQRSRMHEPVAPEHRVANISQLMRRAANCGALTARYL